MNKIILFLIKPYNLVFVTVFISFLAWLYPDMSIRRGFYSKDYFDGTGLLVILLWYSLIVFLAYIGYKIGTKIKPSNSIDKIPDEFFYNSFTVIATIGVLSTYLVLFKANPNFISFITSSQANNLKYILYEDYSAGILSLRYVAILSGAIGLYKLLFLRNINIKNVINVLFLLSTAIISSRLSLTVAVIIVLGLVIKDNVRVTYLKVILSGLVLFFLLTFLNYSRNSLFYKEYYNISNPFLMNFSEILTYLGTPFQATLGLAKNVLDFGQNYSLDNFLFYIVPSFFRPVLGIERDANDSFRSYTNIEESLTTNSAFVDLFESNNFYSVFIIIVIILLSSILIGHLKNYSNYVSLLSFVLLYCFAEIWRTFLFNEGIIQMLILAICISIGFYKVKVAFKKI